ncbi:hypothetical protein ACKKBF_B02870 [Auxenochlorella protothecoides x Auxenochlorella symbiontica]
MDRKSSAGMHHEEEEEEERLQRGHSALQGLLRRLGAGFEDVFHTGASSAAGGGAYHPGNARVRAALGQLRSHDAGEQLAGLAELCEYLAVSTEESLLTFPVDTAVPLLIKCLNEEGEPDVALLAARALTFLADVSGPGGAALVRHGAPAALVGRLLSIEYIDLAEQALQALQKLAGEHPGALLRAGALAAVLAYLDFFPLSVQRVAVDTAAALCRALGADALEAAAAALPSLLGLLQSQDARLAEGAGRAVARMAERYARDRDALATLCALGLVDEVYAVVAARAAGEGGTGGPPPAAFHGLVRLLAQCGAASRHAVAPRLLEAGAAGVGAALLAGSALLGRGGPGAGPAAPASPRSPGSGPGGAGASLVRTPEQAAGVVALIEAVLPAGEDGDGATTDGQPPPRLPHDLTLSLLPVLLRVSEAGTGAGLRLAGLRALATAAAASERSALRAALLPLPVSSSLARALRSGDEGVVAQALRAAELLLDAMPDACPAAFAREGVLHELERLEAEADGRAGSCGAAAASQGARNAAAAARLRRERFAGEPRGAETEAVRCLRDCAAALPDASAVEGLLARLASGEDQAVSTYELGSSGALDALWRHLQGKDLGQDVGARLARWSQFLIAGQRACAAAVPAADPSGGTHLGALVRHALAALEASEKLAVGPSAPAPPPASSSWARLARSALGRGGGGSTADQGALAAGLETLSTPLNLRLCRAPGAEGAGVRDHGASVVSVVPMVTLDQVEDFLWPRVRDERSAPASREVGARSPPGAGTRSGGAGAGAPGGRLTRAQARAAAEAALAAPGAGARGEGEEGGDLDWLTAGMEAAAGEGSGEEGSGLEDDVMEEEDEEEEEDDEEGEGLLSGDVLAAAVHSVDLDSDGFPGLESAAPQLSPPQQQPAAERPRRGAAAAHSSRGERASYARAAAGAGEAAPGAPRLAFFLGATRLPRRGTLLQNLGAALAEEAPDRGDWASRLWNEVHRVTYRLWRAGDEDTGVALEAGSGRPARRTASRRRSGAADDAAVPAALASSDAPPRALAHLFADGFGEVGPALASALGPRAEPGGDPGAAATALGLLSVLAELDRQGRQVLRCHARRGAAGAVRDPAYAPMPETPFSARLAAKAAAALGDVVAVAAGRLPAWLLELAAPPHLALLPFDLRRRVFQLTGLGTARALAAAARAAAAEAGGEDAGRGGARGGDAGGASQASAAGVAAAVARLARTPRQKVRLSRRRLLDSTAKVFAMPGVAQASLEVEFHGEAGTGLGPTLEFYALLAKELTAPELGLWRGDGGGDDSGAAQPGGAPGKRGQGAAGGDNARRAGLFPAPLPPRAADAEARCARFRLAGTAAAKALQDGRLLDLPLSPLMWRMVVAVDGATAEGLAPDLVDLETVDPGLAHGLRRLESAARAPGPARGLVDGVPLADLYLPADRLPGYPGYRLAGVDDAPGALVGVASAPRYVAAVLDATLGAGVARQVAAFRAGFAAVLSPNVLLRFQPEELELLLCGSGEAWTAEELRSAIHCDHGYTPASAPVRWLVEVLAGLGPAQRRAFLSFTTGAPRLPPGGLAALRPRLTVVRKSARSWREEGTGVRPAPPSPASSYGTPGAVSSPGQGAALDADADLPSVMTCANYIKLPPYSCKAVLEARLMYVLAEGQGSFDLS